MLKLRLLCPLPQIRSEVQMIVRVRDPENLMDASPKGSVISFAMRSYDRIRPALIVYLFIAPDRTQVPRLIGTQQRARTSVATGASAFNSSHSHGTSILIKSTIIYQRVITYDMHRAELACIQNVAILGDIIYGGVWRTVVQGNGPRMHRRMRAIHADNIRKTMERIKRQIEKEKDRRNRKTKCSEQQTTTNAKDKEKYPRDNEDRRD